VDNMLPMDTSAEMMSLLMACTSTFQSSPSLDTSYPVLHHSDQTDTESETFGTDLLPFFTHPSGESQLSTSYSSSELSANLLVDDKFLDELVDDDFPPPPTLMRQTGYYDSSTSRSCSCLEAEERTETDYIQI